MSDDYLYSQVLNPNASTHIDKKQSNNDILSNLFAMQLPVNNQKDLKKKKQNQDRHQYIRLAERDDAKASKSIDKFKKEQSIPSNVLKQKREMESKLYSLSKPKEKSTGFQPVRSSSKYMPVVIDPFAKPAKPTPIVEKNSNREERKPKIRESEENSREKLNKVEQKHQKIERKQKERERERLKQRERDRDRNRQKQRQKDHRSQQTKTSSQQPNKLRQQIMANRASKLPQQAPKVKAMNSQIKNTKPAAKQRVSPSSSSQSSSGSSGVSKSSEAEDWRQQIRKLTGYNPRDPKYQKLDRQEIIQSGVQRIFGEDKYSSRMGKREQEQDMRRQQMRIMRNKIKHKMQMNNHH